MEDGAKDTSFNSELLEQWKTCVESADRISQRRMLQTGFYHSGYWRRLTSTAIGGCKSIPFHIVGIGICSVAFIHILV